MSSSANAAALAAFQGMAIRSKSEILHDKKNSPKFKIPLSVDTSGQNHPITHQQQPQSKKPCPRASMNSRRYSQGPSSAAAPSGVSTSRSLLISLSIKPPQQHQNQQQTQQQPQTLPPTPTQLSLPIKLPKFRHPDDALGLLLPTRAKPVTLPSSYTLLKPRLRPTSLIILSRTPTTENAARQLSTLAASTAAKASLAMDHHTPTTPVVGSIRNLCNASPLGFLPNSAASVDYFTLNTNTTPSSLIYQQKQSTAQDMISSVKKSIESKMMVSNSTEGNQNSRDMINQVKQSINSKISKSAAPKKEEVHQKQQNRLQEIRHSIDQKRIQTLQLLNSSSASIAGSSFPQPNISGEFFERSSLHNSYSSLGSSLHSAGDRELHPTTPVLEPTPRIVVREHEIEEDDGEAPHQSQYGADDTDVREEDEHESYREDKTKLFSISNSNSKANRLSQDLNHMDTLESIFLGKKPRRKPPPISSNQGDEFVDFSDLPSLNPPKTPTFEPYSSKSLFEVSRPELPELDIQPQSTSNATAAASDASFPQFPSNLSTKGKEIGGEYKKKHGLFSGSKKKNRSDEIMSETNDDTENEYTDDVDSFVETPPRAAPITQSRHPVQLKTTMRKTNKRKEKKLVFNENKPWKNHNDLTYITEAERKRYEGVWVSNKGLYLNSVVTKLVGVDYSNLNSNSNSTSSSTGVSATPSVTTAKEASLAAAKLSTQVTQENILIDNQSFHGLVQTDILQLIHGLVVKRIWERSRLPSGTLKSIWNLVDFRFDGTLNKPEFLVGMWLVDQCLYGRKLPKTVDQIVWDSLGSIGLNVVVKKKGRR